MHFQIPMGQSGFGGVTVHKFSISRIVTEDTLKGVHLTENKDRTEHMLA